MRYPLAVAAAVFAVACAASPPPPIDALRVAEQSVNRAEQERAEQYAPLQMHTAREKLAQAREAAQDNDRDDLVRSRRLAEQAQVDAELALALTQQVKAEKVNAEMAQGIQSMQEEMDRAGATP